jgi:hypothetical protein
MNFIEAVEEMKLNKKVRRPGWAEGTFIQSDYYNAIVSDDGELAELFIDDLEKNDWISID